MLACSHNCSALRKLLSTFRSPLQTFALRCLAVHAKMKTLNMIRLESNQRRSYLLGQSDTVVRFSNCFLITLTTIIIAIQFVNQVVGHEQGNSSSEESSVVTQSLLKDEEAARKLLDKLEKEVHAECHNRALKEWLYATNLTMENRKAAAESSVSYSRFWRNTWESIRQYDWRSFKDPVVKRQFQLLSVLGLSILSEDDLRKYNGAKQAMESTYATAKVCSYSQPDICNLTLEPELSEIFKQSHDPEELKYYWVQWRDLTGKKMRGNFTDMVAVMDLAAKLNKFEDAEAYDTRAYNSMTFRDDIEKIWQQMKPFYQQLHAYVRYKLRQSYGEDVVPKKWPIPGHLLGNVWAQTWESVYDLVVPFPGKSTIDVTPNMIEKGLTAHDIAKMAEDFFVSLGLSPMPPEFWNGSILEKPIDREIICHARSWKNGLTLENSEIIIV